MIEKESIMLGTDLIQTLGNTTTTKGSGFSLWGWAKSKCINTHQRQLKFHFQYVPFDLQCITVALYK